jgi:hypothetical protein
MNPLGLEPYHFLCDAVAELFQLVVVFPGAFVATTFHHLDATLVQLADYPTVGTVVVVTRYHQTVVGLKRYHHLVAVAQHCYQVFATVDGLYLTAVVTTVPQTVVPGHQAQSQVKVKPGVRPEVLPVPLVEFVYDGIPGVRTLLRYFQFVAFAVFPYFVKGNFAVAVK